VNTICGIDLDLLKRQPSPEELAYIVAGWNSKDQADFLIVLGEQLREQSSGRVAMQWQYIADDLSSTERRLHDESGSELIREIAQRLNGRHPPETPPQGERT
jgi:hypothetical protein